MIKTVLRSLKLLLMLAIVAIGSSSAFAQSSGAEDNYAWEGYWHAKAEYCSKEKAAVPPVGFFSDRVENWEAKCDLVSITRAKNKSAFDTIHLQCTSDKHGKYSQNMRLRVNSEQKLILMWPGGVAYSLVRCPR